LSVYIAFLVSCMVTHGSVPKDFSVSTIIPIPKKQNINSALSSVFCKVFDNLILTKFHDKLCTSDLAICDILAAEYDILFNAGKSKF
jgi:hypothetical protein